MMDVDQTRILLVLAVVLGHVAIVVLVAFKFNLLAMLSAGFLLLAAFSTAKEMTGVEDIKWGRVYFSLLILVTAALMRHPFRFGPSSVALMLGLSFYMIAPAWSGEPVQAYYFRAMSVVTLLAGMMLGAGCRSRQELHACMRLLLVPAVVICFVLLQAIAREPSKVFHLGRLEAFGINSNRIGQVAAPFLIICAYVALHDWVKISRIIAYFAGTFLALVNILTGSRGGVGEAAIGCFFLLIPVVRRPLQVGLVLIALFASFYLISNLVEESKATERLARVDFESRREPWGEAQALIQEKPMFGHGWIYQGSRRQSSTAKNMHSIYLQILAESGFVGFACFGAGMLVIMARSINLYVFTVRRGAASRTIYLALGLCGAVCAWGVVDSGTIWGSTPNCFMLGLSVALFDRVVDHIHADSATLSVTVPDASPGQVQLTASPG